MKNALVIGSKGTIGSALVEHLAAAYSVSQLSRENCDYSDRALLLHAARLEQLAPFDLIICCVGVLHNETDVNDDSWNVIIWNENALNCLMGQMFLHADNLWAASYKLLSVERNGPINSVTRRQGT